MEKELYEYKLDLLYYGIKIDDECFKRLIKGNNNNNVCFDDYITTRGLMLCLDSKIYVSTDIKEESPYIISFINDDYFLRKGDLYICNIDILQPPEFALYEARLISGDFVTNYVNVHGDRLRLQPIEGCAFLCKFCNLNQKKYLLHRIDDLEEAFQ